MVIQMISLMDMLLRKENLDLKLTPYKVLATSLDEGMIQFVPSKPLALILSEHNGNLQAYLKGLKEQNKAIDSLEETYGIHPTVMDTYVKSCGIILLYISHLCFVL